MTQPPPPQGVQPPFETHPLFATPLWLASYPGAAQLNPLLRRHAIEAMEAERGVSTDKRSNRQGWRGPAINLEAMELWAPLGAFVREVLSSLLRPDLEYLILSRGVNVHLEGGFNFSHVHSGCVVSGVYYISCPPGSGEIVFEDPRSQSVFANNYSLFSQDQGEPDVSLTPSEGQLVLFPSWLSHRVEPSASFEPRISLPINVVLLPPRLDRGMEPAAVSSPLRKPILGGRSASSRGFGSG